MSKLLASKIGMTRLFDEAGNVVPVTVLTAGPCIVTQVKTKEHDGYDAIQVGFGSAKKMNKPAAGHQKELKLKSLKEFRLEKPSDYKVGQEIKVDIFKPGERVEVTGISIGKGFQGNIKRHHHHRGPMTHGSKSHRLPGSIGSGTTPGRVYKGRAMPGRMGGEQVTVKNIKIAKIDAEKNLIMLNGAVPGKNKNLLVISSKAAGK